MSFYRERFGHREGEFPVCEDVAARSVALPFFPAMTEGQVERVAARTGGGGRPGSIIAAMASLRADAERARRRRARRSAPSASRRAVALPCAWHRVRRHRQRVPTRRASTCTGWSPWVLMALGCWLRPRRARGLARPRPALLTLGTGAWMGGRITLYLLGFALPPRSPQIADGLSAA